MNSSMLISMISMTYYTNHTLFGGVCQPHRKQSIKKLQFVRPESLVLILCQAISMVSKPFLQIIAFKITRFFKLANQK